ncbi:MAG: outer membrane beta-barrel protein [Acidobacteria bacterium]|nr:outer membrane beta-barrel protein [Acidobacteriota bacterium]
MAQMMKVCGLAAVLAFCAVPFASAQTPAPSTSKFFVSANIGGQLAPRNLDTASSLTVYEEQATLSASTPIGRGILPDFGAGYRVFGDVYVGVTVSMFSKTGDAAYTASVPDPLFFNRAKTVTGTVTGLKHSELGILPQVLYTRALTDKIDFVGGVGPAIFKLKQDIVSGFTVAQGTQNITVTSASESANGTGINASIGANYNLTEKVGIGVVARYAGAKVQLPSAAKKQNVGGMQIGVGIRYNF